MRVELRLGGLISVNGREIALGQTQALLEGIAEERSVAGAATRLGLSYRAAWGRVLALEQAFERAVAVKTKGHGSVLTAFGDGLREALGLSLRSFDEAILQEQRALLGRLRALAGEARPGLRMALSHDPVLASAIANRGDIEANVVGSEEAVALLLEGRADIAGFHTGGEEPATLPSFRALLRQPSFAVEPFFRREQGLIVAPGNPLGIRALRDVGRVRARFVNRQRGSGTRAWFNRLLGEAGMSPSDVVGYDVEEFTHQAVAAVVAAGAADAGMGVRSVAERFGLGFIALGWETYYLAGPPRLLAAVVQDLGPHLTSPAAMKAGCTPVSGGLRPRTARRSPKRGS
jgi:molybdate transport repressor ModE-like protein